MTCWSVSFPLTLSDLQGHLSIASLWKCDCPYTYAAVGKISTDNRVLQLAGSFVAAELLVNTDFVSGFFDPAMKENHMCAQSPHGHSTFEYMHIFL